MIVLADAPLDRAVNAAAWGGLFNSGQTCVSVERVYVEESIYETFVERLVERVREISADNLGAMASTEQLELVASHVRDAKRRGARVPVGGRRAGDRRYEPTVLADVDESMTIMREETFGPVIPVAPVADEEEAIARANDSVLRAVGQRLVRRPQARAPRSRRAWRPAR